MYGPSFPERPPPPEHLFSHRSPKWSISEDGHFALD